MRVAKTHLELLVLFADHLLVLHLAVNLPVVDRVVQVPNHWRVVVEEAFGLRQTTVKRW